MTDELNKFPLQTIVSQYADSPTLSQLVFNFNTYVDPNADLEAFYSLIWNLETAVGYGLDVWGRILNISRVIKLDLPARWFVFGGPPGFPGVSQPTGFSAPFFSHIPLTENVALSDDAYRLLLFAKAAFNICNGTIPAINQLLMNLFPGRGNCYVTDAAPLPTPPRYLKFGEAHHHTGFTAPFVDRLVFGSMSLTYVFEFALTPVEVAIVTKSGVLPTPAGVLASYSYLT